MSKELSEMCPLGEKMAKIWLKLQENGKKKSQMAKEKYILARTLSLNCFGFPRKILIQDTWWHDHPHKFDPANQPETIEIHLEGSDMPDYDVDNSKNSN